MPIIFVDYQPDVTSSVTDKELRLRAERFAREILDKDPNIHVIQVLVSHYNGGSNYAFRSGSCNSYDSLTLEIVQHESSEHEWSYY